ncbi:hypothetical protein B0H15DRAFT_1027501 [Mycena belliarum]|uniref:Uncharacterized protein n=1 Tax=Mycena belliarum TaxID=1033014 RepID=A0AAD6TQI9_9AGAR|nr:hypothetical protein B0H15DRAFT_1027501 [Mycena belliae]
MSTARTESSPTTLGEASYSACGTAQNSTARRYREILSSPKSCAPCRQFMNLLRPTAASIAWRTQRRCSMSLVFSPCSTATVSSVSSMARPTCSAASSSTVRSSTTSTSSSVKPALPRA